MKILLLYLTGILISLFHYADVNKSLGELNSEKNKIIDFNTTECSDLNKFSNEYLLIEYLPIKQSTDSISNLCWEGGDGSDACYYVGGCWGGDAFCGGLCETQDGCTVCHICSYSNPSPIVN